MVNNKFTYINPLIIGLCVSVLKTLSLVISIHHIIKELVSFLQPEFTCFKEGWEWHERNALPIMRHEGAADVSVYCLVLLCALRFDELAECTPYSHDLAQVFNHNGLALQLGVPVGC